MVIGGVEFKPWLFLKVIGTQWYWCGLAPGGNVWAVMNGASPVASALRMYCAWIRGILAQQPCRRNWKQWGSDNLKPPARERVCGKR